MNTTNQALHILSGKIVPSQLEVVGPGLKGEKRPHATALQDADLLKTKLIQAGLQANDIIYAGSLRRKKPVIGDLDIVLCSTKVNKLFYLDFIKSLGLDPTDRAIVKRVGDTLCSFKYGDFLIEFKKTVPDLVGAMLLMATGSADFNVAMRAYVKSHGLSLSEQGLKDSTGKIIASKTEQDIFDALGIEFVKPEDRSQWSPRILKNTPYITHGKRVYGPQTSVQTTSQPTLPGSVQSTKLQVPANILAVLPPDVKAELDTFELPLRDSTGVPIPRDFLWSKRSRQNYYRVRGKLKIPDRLKLDRYLNPTEGIYHRITQTIDEVWKTKSDALEHFYGLTDDEAHLWLTVANNARKWKLDRGVSEKEADGYAIRVANGAVKKKRAGKSESQIREGLRLIEATIKVTYKKYSHYSEIPPDDKKHIQKNLGDDGGSMRGSADLLDSPAVVAYFDKIPVGWAILVQRPTMRKRKAVNVYVAPEWRRRGIGKKLVDELISGETIKLTAIPSTPGAEEFFAGFNGRIVTSQNREAGDVVMMAERSLSDSAVIKIASAWMKKFKNAKFNVSRYEDELIITFYPPFGRDHFGEPEMIANRFFAHPLTKQLKDYLSQTLAQGTIRDFFEWVESEEIDPKKDEEVKALVFHLPFRELEGNIPESFNLSEKQDSLNDALDKLKDDLRKFGTSISLFHSYNSKTIEVFITVDEDLRSQVDKRPYFSKLKKQMGVDWKWDYTGGGYTGYEETARWVIRFKFDTLESCDLYESVQRSMAQLKKEVEQLGLTWPTKGGKEPGKAEVIKLLQQHNLSKMSDIPDHLKHIMQIDTPMLAAQFKELTPAQQKAIWDSGDWIAEEKLDGVRMLAMFTDKGKVAFYSRNISVKDYLPVNYDANIHLGDKANFAHVHDRFILDCELMSTRADIPLPGGETKTKLQAVAGLMALNANDSINIQKQTTLLEFKVFDIIWWNGQWIMNLPYKERRPYLVKAIAQLQNAGFNFHLPSQTSVKKKEFSDSIMASGGEGVILKDVNAPYAPTQSRSHRSWVKVKRSMSGTSTAAGGNDTIDAWISGYSLGAEGKGFENLIGNLELSTTLRMDDGSEKEHHLASVSNIELELRRKMTEVGPGGKPQLRQEYYGQVVEVDGQAVSARGMRLTHPRLIRFRPDRSKDTCFMTEKFLKSMVI